VSRVERSALVPRSQAFLYELVNDFESYPRRFAWCVKAEALEQDAEHKVARMTLSLGGMNVVFTTRNRLEPPSRIAMSLVEGPFTSLEGVWEFRALGEHGAKISLVLSFEPAGRLLGGALALGFHRVADHMVDDFVRAAMAAAP
jgi:ribosome-associated toxin RatA of RatAB toxin-antitoxin module